MKIINYSERERWLIFTLSMELFGLLFTLQYFNIINGLELTANIIYYSAGILMVYSLIAFPVWKSDMRGNESEKEAQFRNHYPEIKKVFDTYEEEERNRQQKKLGAEQAVIKAIAEQYPRWVEDVRKPEFILWLDKQSPIVQFLADSKDPRDALELLRLYDNSCADSAKYSGVNNDNS